LDEKIEENIKNKIEELRGYRRTHFDIGNRLFKAGGDIHSLDLLAFGSLNRSLQLTYAFCDLIEHQQSLAATPLVRLQLDTALRFSAIYLVDKPQELARQVIHGTPIRNMLDKTGAQLTDSYLVKQLAKTHPWVKPVYDNTSGFVHLSDKHVFSALHIDDPDPDPGHFQGYISERDVYIPSGFRLELVDVFKGATDLFFEQVNGWADIKDTFPAQSKPEKQSKRK
jgi:hypothetical protein